MCTGEGNERSYTQSVFNHHRQSVLLRERCDSMTTRRQLLLALGAGAAVPFPVLAQKEKRVRRIGFLTAPSLQTTAARLAAFRAGMLELRWVEGRDYVIDARYANGIAQALPGLATELVATQPDLLLTTGDEVVGLITQRTKTIPVVFTLAQDPVGAGFVASLQRPGGNVTGLMTLSRDLAAKRLQLLKEAFPRVVHVIALFESDNGGSVSQVKEFEETAPRLGLHITTIGVRQPADIEPAFKRGATLGAQAYVLTQSGVITAQFHAIADHVLRSKIPSMAGNTEFVEAGGLLSYAASSTDNFHRAAAYVDKILKGAKPADLPTEQPTRFELVINMKSAKAMGLVIPQSFLLRADRVIQ